MSDDQPERPAAGSNDRPKRRPFHRFQGPRLAPDGVERQSRVTLHAWTMMGPDAAIAFLNSFNEALGGRPLDLAVASQAGLEAVERAISASGGRE